MYEMRNLYIMETPSVPNDRSTRLRETAARIATIVLLMVVIGLLASTYIGHATSPYGVCYGASGRSIPCAIAERASEK
jgi:hypothetical protein